ncbi:electron transport complex subunit RsxG [Propionivibrio limicola]|uniref:electron transport complex subunit RsxG n=1 Tax=Propionivibrio limicola TaxID=167645 RepID=UPI0012923A52|nr:electron transport complex subunit RsxG [Propionivibrio limicola]
MNHLVRPPSAPQMAVRTALILVLFMVVFTALLSGAYLWTRPAIEAAAAEEKMKLIDEVLPRQSYDNDLLNDFVRLEPVAALGTDTEMKLFRARKNGQIETLVFEAVAPDGYAGKIRLLIALGVDGTLRGVRVIQHKETPGVGDYIEPKKDKNREGPWITQFDGLAPSIVDERDWKVKKDGGRFDSVAGATVTPRAIIKAVRKAALYVEANRVRLTAGQ